MNQSMLNNAMLTVTEIDPIPKRKERPQPVVSNGMMGMLIFIGTEIMFFAALISAYLVIRSAITEWPPWGQPRLPVEVTAVNTFFLLASGWIIFQAKKTLRRGNIVRTRQQVGFGIILGAIFVSIQGYEWTRLIGHGLTMTSSTHGGVFYLIIGTHAIHAMIGIGVLAHLYTQLTPERAIRLSIPEFTVSQLFWSFVVGVWPILYILVYLL